MFSMQFSGLNNAVVLNKLKCLVVIGCLSRCL